MLGTRMEKGRVDVARLTEDKHRVRVDNRASVGATVKAIQRRDRTRQPIIFKVILEYGFFWCVGKMMDIVLMFRVVYCRTSFKSGVRSTTATDSPISLQFIDGASAYTNELHTL
ncbi:hypothetical protein EVAR_93213_1 [Eumeta japonica]|uniref:Uncharacterized protein n=1 Tax=Eumeta variegata TaxID=151549 RepID=A0A4C1TXL7_EUMVA|nr:hypothetical protein EVAR_93213_1 [Eumeta japonica]